MAPLSSVCCCLVVLCSVYLYFSPLFSSTNVKDDSSVSKEIISSVWCRGKDRNSRICYFRNLCYFPNVSQFIFYFSNSSDVVGVDSEKQFFRNIVDTSSIENHNSLTLSFTVIPSIKTQVHFVKKPVFLISRFKPDNLMHVIHDDLFPLYHTYGDVCFGNIHQCRQKFTLLFVDGQGIYFPQLYEVFGNEIIFPPNSEPVCYSQLYAGMSKETVWYQYGYHGEQGPTQNHLTGIHVRRFGEFLLNNLRGNRTDCPANGTVLLSRRRTRRILNEDQLVQSLSKMNVTKLSLEENDLLMIFRCIRNSRLLIGMHGALLVSSLFLQPSTRLLELFPPGINSSHITPYKTLVTLPLMGIHYEALEDNSDANGYVYPGICCDDPTWLHFMNQDTLVNIKQIKSLVNKMEQNSHVFIQKWEDALLYPSPPSNAQCRWLPDHLMITWNQPWNIKLMGAKAQKVHYDLMVAGDNFQRQYFTIKLALNVTIDTPTLSVRIWLKCLVNELYQSADSVLLCEKSE